MEPDPIPCWPSDAGFSCAAVGASPPSLSNALAAIRALCRPGAPPTAQAQGAALAAALGLGRPQADL